MAIEGRGSPWATGTVCVSLAFRPEVAPGHGTQPSQAVPRTRTRTPPMLQGGPHLYLFPQEAFTPF